MRRNHPYKDIFIVHSKKNRTERDIASGIAKILYKNGYTIWNYQDWKWTNEILTTYSSSGTNIDVVRFISGARDSFIEEDGGDINIQDLSSIILKRTRLVICINPVTGKPTSGVREEVQILTNDQGKTIPLFGCPRRIILCSVENREPHHIFSNLSYSDLINICLTEDDPQKDEIDSFKVGFYPSVCSIAAITAFIARYLWLQSLENKEGKGNAIDLEHKRSRIILQELTNIPPDFDDPGFDLKFKHQELLQNDLNCVFPVIGETVKLADNLYELVEYIVLKNSDLEQTGTLGPWNFGGFQFKVSYFGPQAVTRCIFVKFSDYNVTLDFQGKGWVFLELNGTTRFSQRLFSRTPSNPPKKDSLEGDIDLFLKIGHQVLTVAQKENNM